MKVGSANAGVNTSGRTGRFFSIECDVYSLMHGKVEANSRH